MKNPNPAVVTNVAAFALDGTALDEAPAPLFEHDGTVYRIGKLFEAGDYPDKDYSMTPDELATAAAAFAPGDAPVDIEHMDTVLSNRLGEVVSVESTDDGKELRGIVALPKWLDVALGSSARKVSATWNRATKRLEGLALVLSPRVSDAALMAAFTAQQEGSPTAAMSTLSQAQRDALSTDDFGDPENRLYPIKDQDDVDSAASLIGKAGNPDAVKKRIIAIANRKNLKIPDAWQEGAKMTQAAFVAWDRATVDSLPDTSFLWVADNGTRHLPVRDQDGKLSVPQLAEAVRRLSQPAAFSGTAMPQDTILTFATTMLQDATSDMERLAQFAADHHTAEGQAVLQTIHDHTARSGAVCPKPGDSADMAARHEATAIQKIHDLTADHGAQHSTIPGMPGTPRPAAIPAAPGGLDTTTMSAASTKSERKGSRMGNIWERFVQFMAANPDAVNDLAETGRAVEDADRAAHPAAQTGAQAVSQAAMAATRAAPTRTQAEEELIRVKGELAAEQAENRRISAQRIADDAVRFADGYIREGQAFPAERTQIMDAFIQASTDDILLPGSVTFANGKQGSRVEVLRAAYDARPAHQLTSESLGAGVFAVLANAPTTETAASRAERPMDPADVKKLIESTALGRAAMGLAAKGATGANGVNGTNH